MQGRNTVSERTVIPTEKNKQESADHSSKFEQQHYIYIYSKIRNALLPAFRVEHKKERTLVVEREKKRRKEKRRG